MRSILSLWMLACLLLSACTSAATTPAQQIAQVSELPAEPAPTRALPPTASPTAPPTDTPLPTQTPVPTVPPTATAPACTNKAELVKHLLASPNTAVKPEEYFVKMWRIKNSGDCTWSTAYELVFVDGDQMSGPDRVPFPHPVAPGETIDLRLDLFGPLTLYSHTGKWMLRAEDGSLFGLGEAGDPLEVVVMVHPTPFPTPF